MIEQPEKLFLSDISPEDNVSPIKKLDLIMTQLGREIGAPDIETTPKGIRPFFKVATPISVVKLLERFFGEYQQPKDNKQSPWRIYARLNLEGIFSCSRPEILNAIRFGHITITSGDLPNDDVITSTVSKVLDEGFPWHKGNVSNHDADYDDGLKRVREAIRIGGLTFIKVKVDDLTREEGEAFSDNSKQLRQDKQKEQPNERKILQPAIIDFTGIESNESNNERKRELVHQYLSERPFVILLDKHGDYTTFHLIANHEFIDGVPAAYYLRKIIDRLGEVKQQPQKLRVIDLSEINREDLEKIFKRADLIEQHNNSNGELVESYAVQSFILSKELVKEIIDLYLEVIRNIGKSFDLNFDTFFQMILFHLCGVDEISVRGGSLKFSLNRLEQLGFYPVGNVEKALIALLADEDELKTVFGFQSDNSSVIDFRKELLGELGFLNNERTRMTLFKNGDLVREIIGRVERLFPSGMHGKINELSKTFKLALLLTGKVMTSNVPSMIKDKTQGLDINLGGIGGPAMTEWQEAAFTFNMSDGRIKVKDGQLGVQISNEFYSLSYDEKEGYYYILNGKRMPFIIAIRRKYKKENK